MISLSFIEVFFLIIIIFFLLNNNAIYQSNAFALNNKEIKTAKFVKHLINNRKAKNLKRIKRGVYDNIINLNNKNNNIRKPSDLLESAQPLDEYMQMFIVSEHNRYRKAVPATDMRMIYWSKELAASAQAHANTCDFRHSRNRIRIGENIWAAPHYNYTDAVFAWYNEVNDPYCQCNHAYKHCCGHYVQVVWAQTNLVGCGFSICYDIQGILGLGHRAVFVCHYSPEGNKIFFNNGQLIAMPAFTWANTNNERCKNCPEDAPACHEGLCYMPLQIVQKKIKNEDEKLLNTNLIVSA